MASTWNNQPLEELAKLIDPAVVRGWVNYYGRYYRTKCIAALLHVNEALAQAALAGAATMMCIRMKSFS
jgi:RNA-directed DNA polymerase